MFKSLRASIVTITAFAIVLVSTVLLWIATNVYESLYSRSAVDDLDALSDNLAIDLIPYMASDKDIFAISNQLLRLDKYDNVEYAAVFDENRTLILPYVGHVVMRLQEQRNEDLQLADKVSLYHTSAIGMQENDDNSIAFKVIGESEYPLGYLLIVNDLTIPLTESKQELVLAVLPLMALMLIIVIIVFVGLQNHALRPLTELSAFMQKIKSTKDYALTTEVKGKSEIAMLTEGFNDMMQTINTEVIKNKEQTETLLLQREQMEKLANFDTLTNLPNRQFFLKILRVALAHAQKEHTDLAIMFFDLDGFKPVNDSFGHDVGDELL
ncbi:MAG: diguanylate cyclase, partial [Pseudomonadota bacterium]